MKILIDGRLLSNHPTGISRYSEKIIDMYIKKFGYENVLVIINKNLNNKNFKFIETKFKPYNLIDFLFFYNFLKKIEFDIYHSLFYANSFIKIKNKIYITTAHDLMYKVVEVFFGPNKLYNFLCLKYYDLIVGISLRNSDIIISDSQSTSKDIKLKFKLESHVVPLGVNYYNNELETSNPLVIGDYFLYVGNARPHKNLDFLVKAYLMSKTNKKLIICGNNAFFNKDKKIIVFPYASDNELNWLYQNASAFIFPSIYEGFGLPILEALSHNLKVFSSNGGSLKEFPEEVVKYFNPNNSDELIALIENSDNIQVDRKKIKETLTYYSWENTEAKMNLIWEEFL